MYRLGRRYIGIMGLYRGYVGFRDRTATIDSEMERKGNMKWKLGICRGF